MQSLRPLHNEYPRRPGHIAGTLRKLLSLGLVTGLLFGSAWARGAPHSSLVHPQDGPHVDLRIEITPPQVLFEVVLNLAFADELVPIARESVDVLHPVEYGALEASLRERFGALVDVLAGDEPLSASPGVFEVYEPDPSLMGLFPVYGPRALTQIRLHWSYTLPSESDTVAIRWDAYPEDTAERRLDASGPREVLARLQAGGVQSVITFREGEGPFRWNASGSPEDHLLPVPGFTPVPARRFPLLPAALGVCGLGVLTVTALGHARRRALVAVLLLTGAVVARRVGHVTLDPGQPLPDVETARAIFEPLHRNIYRAFDYAEEEDVYDALARCVDGELLERLYTEIYASLREEEAGGAVGSVQELRWIDVTPRDIENAAEATGALVFGVDARWQVEGAVFHWGHAHWRVQELAGRYRVRHTEQGWRIAESTVEEQILIHAGQRLPGEDGPSDAEIPEEL